MLDIFRKLYDTIFPLREPLALIEPLTPEIFCTKLTPIKVKNTLALANYHDPYIKAAITANKFYDSAHAAELLGALLHTWVKTHSDTPTLFVPIPLSSSRKKSRGYNQVTRVLEQVPNIKISHLLIRERDTLPQTSLNRTERLRNMTNAFIPRDKSMYTDVRIFIIDDVLTTGATLAAAEKALLPVCGKNCEIRCIALAH